MPRFLKVRGLTVTGRAEAEYRQYEGNAEIRPPVFMAIATFNPSVPRLRGKVGGLVFKHYGDKVVVTRAPTFSGKWSAAQLTGRNRFAQASAYARRVQVDPLLRAKYEQIAAQRGLTVRSAAISAYLKGDASSIEASRQPQARPESGSSNPREKIPARAALPGRRRQFRSSPALMCHETGNRRITGFLSHAPRRVTHSRWFFRSHEPESRTEKEYTFPRGAYP